MNRRFRISTLTRGQLRARLALLFAALAVPTGLLVWQAYGQLKWESFHHYRELAADLTQRIDAAVSEQVERTEAHSFGDYSFLVVEGDAERNFLQRSPLSAFPVVSDPPGALGWFQVDGEGRFTTPLLPPDGVSPESVGISAEEFAARQSQALRILDVLADNRLVQAPAELPFSGSDDSQTGSVVENDDGTRRTRRDPGAQAAFDALSKAREEKSVAAPASPLSAELAAHEAAEPAADAELFAGNSLGKVADLNLETPYRKELQESAAAAGRAAADRTARSGRTEQVAIPETVSATSDESGEAQLDRRDVRVDTFESEIDPLEFSLLDSGHVVLFRKVWRDRERFIQGLLIERGPFMREVVDAYFLGSVTAGMSDLLVAWGEDVIHSGSGADSTRYASGMLQAPAPLLYRSRLSSPLDGLELIYRVRHLPPGPGASVLAWVTLLIAAVFCGGFIALYRLGAGQIELARQQQDFVSAVSHELKTPLTSIRMYGEMLKEGWADAAKRQQYYEYIHDESERLTRLIANVLQLASITRNRQKLDVKRIEVGRLMQDIESRIANQVRQAGFELRCERDPRAESAMISVDPDCVVQIMINLVDNAIKFSGKAAVRAVELSSRPVPGGSVRFAVRDFGPGVPKSQMRKIFRLFYRGGSELTRETVGTGIGLAIVHELTAAMGGKVDVVNREPGAEFIVTFPAVPT